MIVEAECAATPLDGKSSLLSDFTMNRDVIGLSFLALVIGALAAPVAYTWCR
jgi:hypothetical protein